MEIPAPITDDSLFAQVDAYPWSSDEEFQAGLEAILGKQSPPEQAIELTLRARCFYYSRKFNTPIDFDAYKAYRSRQSAPSAAGAQEASNGMQMAPSAEIPATDVTDNTPNSGEIPPGVSEQPQAPYPSSFSEIVKLITSGQPIPGIKDVPPTILEGQGTTSSKTTRRKPWEKE